MNYARLAAAAVAATVVDAIYGFLVYGLLLAPEFGRYPSVYRPNDAPPVYLATMFAGILVAMFVAVAIYHKGYEGKDAGALEGMRFGALLGVFVAVLFASISYGTMLIGRRLPLMTTVAGIVEWTLVGATIGAVYRPVAGPVGRKAMV